MECLYCGEDLKKGFAPFTIFRNGYYIAIEKVPAYVCTQCGEPLFDKPSVDIIQGIIKQMDNKVCEIRKLNSAKSVLV